MKISPCDLIQEHLAVMSDPSWRICTACMLMNMTRGLTMRPYMWKLFERWPRPRDIAFADDCDDIAELRELIRPLGFVNRRSMNIINMSRAYIRGRWATPSDLPGCGKYATDSWLIFVVGADVDIADLQDKELRRYIHWRKTGEYIPQDRTV